jgi:RNA polymerase sigma-70 factor (ECF subfamily)
MVRVKENVPVRNDREQELELAEAFRALDGGDMSALDTVWDRIGAKLHGLALWRTGNVEDAADVVQDVFTRIAGKMTAAGKAKSPTGWLMTVTHRIAIDHIRKRRVRKSASLEECHYLADPAGDPAGMAEANQVSRLLGRLPAEQREAIYLRLYAGCTFTEIGKITGRTRFTAASRYRLGIDKLRQMLDEGAS